MGVKQIVFGPGAAASLASDSSGLGVFDYVMIGTLVVLVAVSIYYIVTTQRSVKKVEEKFFAAARSAAQQPREVVTAVEEVTTYRVVYLYMSGCPYCVKFDKTHAEAAGDTDLTKRFSFNKVDAHSPDAAAYKQYQCSGFPCYLVFDDRTGTMVERGTGYRPAADFKSWLMTLLPSV
jgi:hypothetical protein